MATYVLMTRLSPEAVSKPGAILELEKAVAGKLKSQCPQAKWLASYSILGGCDYLDIFEAPDEGVASQVALVIRSLGHATTETWVATPWARFRELARAVSGSQPKARSRPRRQA
ncbi:MAG: GYD domain-containing protein [Chloroflexi bacterium]|nr:GYD domain-containing protein [Chloroflexota bacterium]